MQIEKEFRGNLNYSCEQLTKPWIESNKLTMKWNPSYVKGIWGVNEIINTITKDRWTSAFISRV